MRGRREILLAGPIKLTIVLVNKSCSDRLDRHDRQRTADPPIYLRIQRRHALLGPCPPRAMTSRRARAFWSGPLRTSVLGR
jgi:hypothetical protein